MVLQILLQKKFQDYMKSKKITHFTTHGMKQAKYVERFIKTIKSKIYRYIVQNNTPRYIDVLDKLVKSYNNTWHSGIQAIPSQVTKKDYGGKCIGLNINLLKDENRKKIAYKFNIGDKVRV